MGSLEPSDYVWTETQPGRWERDVDEVEQFYTSLEKRYEGSGRYFFAMTGYISFSVSGTDQEVEDALRKAWLRLRYDHPSIGSRVEYCDAQKKCRKVYEMVPSPESQQKWLDTTLCIVPTKLSGLQWCNADPPVPKLPTLFLIKSRIPSRGVFKADLVLRCHHDIIDGIGTLMLFNNLFKHAAKALEQGDAYPLPSFGNEFTRLSPPLRVAAGLPPVLSAHRQACLDKIISYNVALKKGVEITSLPYRKGPTNPGKHQRVAITLSSEQTHRLLRACKALGLSVTHAYHTALAIVIRDLQKRQSRPRTVRYISHSLINERPHCTEPYDSPAHAVSLYHSTSGGCLAIDLIVPAASIGARDRVFDYSILRRREYMKVASVVRQFYLRTRNDKDHINMVPSYWAMGTYPYPPDNHTPPVPKPNDHPSVSISSIGTLDKTISPIHGAFELDNPWVTGEELGTGLGLFLGTWRGRLTLSAAFNDAWHTRNEALAFLDRCNVITIQALGA
ncbi:hypothetical protein P175DRAFT_0455566 [Aspergillus ochraceoroseus IBT 24754]|uniref:Condensation domain-containing protein n=1 Tax=Aspergillus ochraceoroseus IBT 24754 TaxID=1392256 RepID=A0A2T5M4Y0_9EURO|nr:uncharacterized protein P175DRAFT_0455566 [Aspergillus ochraceoroseus IBT 24754]PTU23589.1 hypothetical protein P175DRAFT_0455566 [Aspergillus ochraceoroseus IBT 24754]